MESRLLENNSGNALRCFGGVSVDLFSVRFSALFTFLFIYFFLICEALIGILISDRSDQIDRSYLIVMKLNVIIYTL